MLLKAGFTDEPGKGSHTKWFHSRFKGRITLSGKDGDDVKRYQEKEVRQAIEQVKEEQ